MVFEASDFVIACHSGKFASQHTCDLGVRFPHAWQGRTIILVDRNNFDILNMGNQVDNNIYLILRIHLVFNGTLYRSLKIDKDVLFFRNSNKDSYFDFKGSLWSDNLGMMLSISQIPYRNKKYIIERALENPHSLSTNEVGKVELKISIEARETGEPIATTNQYPLPVQINTGKRKKEKILQQQKDAVEKKENPRPKKRRKKESAPT
jgi:hypothetical protein